MGTSEEMTTEPAAIYGEETNCDVVFLAGRGDDDVWRLPAHKCVLTRENPVFRAMNIHDEEFYRGDIAAPYTIRVNDVDCRALDNLLRFLYNEPVSVQSVETALYTLYAADKYFCPGLTRVCVSYLLDNLNLTNALSILKYIRVFSEDYHQNLQNLTKEQEITGTLQDFRTLDNPLKHKNEFGRQSSHSTATKHENNSNSEVPILSKKSKKNPKKSNVESSQSEEGGNTKVEHPASVEVMDVDCASLLQKCLLYVDSVADEILTSEEFEDLDGSAIQLILGRDTLNVKSEMVVFTSLMRWADKECKRKQKPLTSDSKREVLLEAKFLPRYLTMKKSDFLSGPARSELFSEEEVQALLRIFEENEISMSMSASNNNTGGNNNGSCVSEDDERIKNVLNSVRPYTPVTLQPYIYSLMCKRKPLPSKLNLNTSRQQKRNKRLPLIKRFLCFKNCCKVMRVTPPNSPIRSFGNNKSPFCCNHGERRHSFGNSQQYSPQLPCGNHNNPSAFNSVLNGIIICWAFFFD